MTLTKQHLKDLKALDQKKRREETGLFLIEGTRLVAEAAGSHFEMVEILCTTEYADDPSHQPLLEKVRRKGKLYRITQRELDSFTETVHAQGIAAVLVQKQTSPVDVLQDHASTRLLVALDALSDPGNLGSVIRTCDWFGMDGLLISANSVDLFNSKVVRATMGGMFHLPIAGGVDLPAALSKAKELGYTIYAADPAGSSHFDRLNYAGRSIVVFGNEAWGLSDAVRALADARVAIRKYGTVESLNVGVACGVILSAMRRLSN